MRAFVLAATMLSVLFAGCSDSGDEPDIPTSAECLEQGLVLGEDEAGVPVCVEPPFEVREFEDPAHFCVTSKQRDRLHAPDLVGDPWVLGDSWEYSLVVDGEDRGTTKLVYYDDQDFDPDGVAQHYMVGTPTRDEALHHALFSENPMIGRVHRILYSPHESGDHADMFHFPLCTGSTWTTVFYGETFTLTATEVADGTFSHASGPINGRAFRIEGTSSEGSTLALSYSQETQWFTFIDLQRADGGSVQMSLVRKDAGYSGPAFFLRGQQDDTIDVTGIDAAGAAGVVLPPLHDLTFEREDGKDGAYDTLGLFIRADQNGSVVLGQASLTAPDGTEAWTSQIQVIASGDPLEEVVEVPYQAGTWTVSLAGVAVDPTLGARLGLHVQVVSIYDRSGSV